MKCKNPAKCLQPASVFSLAQAKGLLWTMPAFRIVVSIKATRAQLVDLYVNACVKWCLFNTVNAFGLKDVGFITFLKPISVMAVNNWVPAPFSKMSTNALWTLKYPYCIRVRKQLWKQVLLHLEHATNFQQKFRLSFRVDIMLPDNSWLQLRKRPDLSIRTLQNDKAHANIAAVCALWIIRTQDMFCWIEVLFGPHKPWIVSVGRDPVKLSELGDFGWCCFALFTDCQVDSWVVGFSNVSDVDFAVSHWDSNGEDGSEHFSGHKSR